MPFLAHLYLNNTIDLSRYTPQRKMSALPTITWKDTQTLEMRKGKLIPWWDITMMRMPEIGKIDPTICWQGCDQLEMIHWWWEYKMVQSLKKLFDGFLKYLAYTYHTTQPYHSHTFSPRERKTDVPTKTYKWLLRKALFIIAQNWKQPRCPSTTEWSNWNTIWQ